MVSVFSHSMDISWLSLFIYLFPRMGFISESATAGSGQDNQADEVSAPTICANDFNEYRSLFQGVVT